MAFIRQRRKTDCGVAALAMLCDTTYEAADRAIPWRREGSKGGTRTSQLREGARKLGYRTEGTTKNHLKVIQAPDGWVEEHGTKVDHRIWTFIPDNSLVKLPKPLGRNWHWVVWRNGKIYDPAVGVFKPRKYAELDGHELFPTSYLQFIKIEDPCPECGAELKAKWSGEECTECDYWFCY